jgi:hypothetical protein
MMMTALTLALAAAVAVAVPIAFIAMLAPTVKTLAAAVAVSIAFAVAAPIPARSAPTVVVPAPIMAAEKEEIERIWERQIYLRGRGQRRAGGIVDALPHHRRMRGRRPEPKRQRRDPQKCSRHLLSPHLREISRPAEIVEYSRRHHSRAVLT